MKILLSGATGYIGKRLLPILVSEGNEVICCVRDRNRFNPPTSLQDSIEIVEVDFLKKESLQCVPEDIDAAYYLIHSMSSGSSDFSNLEAESASNFKNRINETQAKQVIYLGGIVNNNELSKHLSSRKKVESVLAEGHYHLTTLRAGIIVGSGSASFEIIRDLVEKLPIMVAPKWLNTRCQPIAISDVIKFLTGVLLNPKTYDQIFDIGGHEVFTYKEMLMGFAKVRKLKRWIFTVPVMTPKLSSYWLFFVTSTSYNLAKNLVDSMKVEVVCEDEKLKKILSIQPITYEKALVKAFEKIDQNLIVSSWKDSVISGRL